MQVSASIMSEAEGSARTTREPLWREVTPILRQCSAELEARSCPACHRKLPRLAPAGALRLLGLPGSGSMFPVQLGEMIHSERFSLFDAMSALEIMDPKMDAGMSAGDVKVRTSAVVCGSLLGTINGCLPRRPSTSASAAASCPCRSATPI